MAVVMIVVVVVVVVVVMKVVVVAVLVVMVVAVVAVLVIKWKVELCHNQGQTWLVAAVQAPLLTGLPQTLQIWRRSKVSFSFSSGRWTVRMGRLSTNTAAELLGWVQTAGCRVTLGASCHILRCAAGHAAQGLPQLGW